MKIKVTQPILGYDGKPLTGEKPESIFTARELLSQALNTLVEGETLLAEDKARIYSISTRLWDDNEVNLTINDRAFIMERAGKTLSPMGYGRVCDLLEAESNQETSSDTKKA